MASSSGPSSQGLTLVIFLVVMAVLVGVVASFLLASVPQPSAAHAGQLVVDLPTEVWGLLFLLPMLTGLGAILFRRFTEPAWHVPSSAIPMFVMILALAIAFLYLFAAFGGSGNGSITLVGGTPTSPTNTSNPPPPNGTPAPPATANRTAGYTLSLPAWVWVAVGAVVAGLVALVAAPGVLSALVDRRARSGPAPVPDRRQIQDALTEAGAAIDRGEDPRVTVVRLYVRLLEAIAPRVGDLSSLTADEIRVRALAPLGIDPGASEVLTRLFEEARYSTHPVLPDDAGRFREAIRRAERDLLRGTAS